MRLPSPVLSLLILLPCALSGADSDSEIRAGAEDMRAERWEAAKTHIVAAREAVGDHPDVLTLLGICEYHLGEYRPAARSLRRGHDGGTRYPARALYYLGLSHAKLGEDAASERAFRLLAERHPDSPEAKKVSVTTGVPLPDAPVPATVHSADAATAKMDWRFFGLIGAYYDSNPGQVAENLPGVSEDGDVFGQIMAGVRFPLGESAWEIRGGAFHKNYFDSNRFDTIGANASLGAHWEGRTLDVAPQFEVRSLWFDYDFFQVRGEVGVGLEWHVADRWDVLARPFASYLLHGSGFGGLDGPQYGGSVGLRWKPAWRPLQWIRAEVRGDAYDADDGSSAWVEVKPVVGSRWALPWSAAVLAEVSWLHREYQGTATGHAKSREDGRLDLGVTYQHALTARWILTGRAGWRDNHSNINAFDYDQFVLGGGIMFVY